MSQAWRNTLIAGVLLAILGGLYGWFSQPQPIPVVLHTVTKGPVEATVANTRAGAVKSCLRAGLSPTRGGRVTQLKVREGDRVEAGQLLLELWNEDLHAQLLLAQRAETAADARAEEVCLLAQMAQREARRARQLRPKKLLSEDELDPTVTDANARRAACRAAGTSAQVSAAEVSVAQAALERTRLYAPFSGVVAEVTGEVGEYVTPSPPGIPTPPAIDLIDYNCYFISAPIDEVDAPAIQLDQPVRVTLDAFRGKSLPARVRRIAPYVLDREKQARTVEVEVALEEPEAGAQLLPGYSADIEVILERREAVLRVPAEAVLEGNRVLYFNAVGGVLEERGIEIGLTNWVFSEVLAGLEEGDRIALSTDREGVKAGAYVTAEKIASTTP